MPYTYDLSKTAVPSDSIPLLVDTVSAEETDGETEKNMPFPSAPSSGMKVISPSESIPSSVDSVPDIPQAFPVKQNEEAQECYFALEAGHAGLERQQQQATDVVMGRGELNKFLMDTASKFLDEITTEMDLQLGHREDTEKKMAKEKVELEEQINMLAAQFGDLQDGLQGELKEEKERNKRQEKEWDSKNNRLLEELEKEKQTNKKKVAELVWKNRRLQAYEKEVRELKKEKETSDMKLKVLQDELKDKGKKSGKSRPNNQAEHTF